MAAVVRELRETVLNSRVSNVYQLDARTLLFKLHKRDRPVSRLLLEAGQRLHLTSYVTEKPKVPPAFCMALRKYLRNGWLVNVEQHGFERVVVFSFKTKSGTVKLVLELFGVGNIILLDEKGEILHALSYKRMRDRNILRGEVFRFAPSVSENPLTVDKEELSGGLRKFDDIEIVRALARFLGVGGVYAEEVLLRVKIDKKKPCNALSESEVDGIFEELQRMLSQVLGGKMEPYTVSDKAGDFVDVVPIRLERYHGFKHEAYESFNTALDEFYVRVTAIERALAAVKVDESQKEAERLQRILDSQEKVLVEAEAKADSYKHIGDAIYAHSSELQSLLNQFVAEKKNGKDWSNISSKVLAEKKAGLKRAVFFESLDVKHLVVNVSVEGLRFGLDLRRDLYANASRFYERGKKAKRRLKGAQTALEETRKKLEEAETRIKEAKALEKVKPVEALEEVAERKVKRKEWFEKFRWFVSSDGFLVVAGKDAVSNEVLVKKYAEDNDVVFHADVAGAPFVAIKTEGKKLSEQCLREAGEFAAAFSRGWREGFASIDVYWVKPDQLSKGGDSGEYVPRGAFVVRGKRNWMRGVPLKTAVGVIAEKNGEVRFLGGPVDSVKAKTNAYIVVMPGDLEGKSFLKSILKTLAMKLPKRFREKASKASVEEIREYIPYSKGRIFEN